MQPQPCGTKVQHMLRPLSPSISLRHTLRASNHWALSSPFALVRRWASLSLPCEMGLRAQSTGFQGIEG